MGRRIVRIVHGISEHMIGHHQHSRTGTLLEKAVEHWSDALDREAAQTRFIKRMGLYNEFCAYSPGRTKSSNPSNEWHSVKANSFVEIKPGDLVLPGQVLLGHTRSSNSLC